MTHKEQVKILVIKANNVQYDLDRMNAPILIYANTINNRIVFKIKTGYKLELLSKETMKLLGST